jgi:hypothetical protein
MNEKVKGLLLVLFVLSPLFLVARKKYRISIQPRHRVTKTFKWDMKDLRTGQGAPITRTKKVAILFENLYPQTSQQRTCLDAALSGMRVGGKRRVVFPPLSGTGRNPASPEAPLVYNVELLSVTEEDPDLVPRKSLIKTAPKKKTIRRRPMPQMNVIDFSGG